MKKKTSTTIKPDFKVAAPANTASQLGGSSVGSAISDNKSTTTIDVNKNRKYTHTRLIVRNVARVVRY